MPKFGQGLIKAEDGATATLTEPPPPEEPAVALGEEAPKTEVKPTTDGPDPLARPPLLFGPNVEVRPAPVPEVEDTPLSAEPPKFKGTKGTECLLSERRALRFLGFGAAAGEVFFALKGFICTQPGKRHPVGTCWPSAKRLGQLLAVDERNVRRHIDALQAGGIVRLHARKPYHRAFRLVELDALDESQLSELKLRRAAADVPLMSGIVPESNRMQRNAALQNGSGGSKRPGTSARRTEGVQKGSKVLNQSSKSFDDSAPSARDVRVREPRKCVPPSSFTAPKPKASFEATTDTNSPYIERLGIELANRVAPIPCARERALLYAGDIEGFRREVQQSGFDLQVLEQAIQASAAPTSRQFLDQTQLRHRVEELQRLLPMAEAVHTEAQDAVSLLGGIQRLPAGDKTLGAVLELRRGFPDLHGKFVPALRRLVDHAADNPNARIDVRGWLIACRAGVGVGAAAD